MLQEIQKRHAGVYIKSRAHGFGEEDLLRITVHATGESDTSARALANAALADLRERFGALQIPVTESDGRS